MRHATSILALAALGLAALAPAGEAGMRNPQVSFYAPTLQSYLSGIGQVIDVTADQQDVQVMHRTGGTSTFTFALELAGNGPQNEIGVYRGDLATPTLIPVFPGAASQGWFAIATFQPSGDLVVNLYDDNSVLQSSTVHPGFDGSNFGFYLHGPGGTFFTQDSRNPGGTPQTLFFAASGAHAGGYWMAFEDLPFAGSDADFNDAVILLEAVSPTPTGVWSWGALKNRYR